MRIFNLNKQQGIGLIEVMIAAVIFALGSIAIIQLQGNFFKSSNAALGRSVAMSIAEEKLEDLRNFENFDDTDADIFDFTSITSNAGGQCDTTDDAACVLTLASTGGVQNITVNNLSFSRDWAVTDYYYSSAGALSTAISGNIAQKVIEVTIAWIDTDGSAQDLTLETVINSNSTSSGGVIVSNAGGSGESPEVPYTPSTDNRVTPIQVGTSSKRETLVPTSDTVDGYTRTNFTAYTYNSSNVLLRQEEFQNVACNCRFDGTSSVGSETYGPAHAQWDTTKDTYVDVDGDLVASKVKGCVQGGGSNCDANPDALCETCCQNHHDTSSLTRKYDPYRSTDDYTSGNHNHYSGTAVVTSGQYQESCRMKRIDGFWRVYQDWNLVNFKTLPLTDLSNATTKATYATFVKDIVDAHLDESKVSGETLTTPPSVPATLDHNVSTNYVNMNVGDVAEVSGRGLYLDFIEATHLTQVKAKKAANEDYLLHLPFYEIEIVEVSDWSSSDDAVVRVGPYDGPGPNNDLDAGEIAALATDTNAVIVTADIRKSNTGLTDMNVSVDYDATTNADDEILSDSLTVCVGCSVAPSVDCTWAGGTVINGNSTTAFQSASVISPATCTSETRTCTSGTLSGTYANASCSVITALDCSVSPWGVIADGSDVSAAQASTVISPATCQYETRTCTLGVLSGSYAFDGCTPIALTCDTSVSGKANNKNDSITVNDGTTDYACSVANSKNYTCPAVTTATNGIVTVTSAGTVNLPTILGTICGAKTVNF